MWRRSGEKRKTIAIVGTGGSIATVARSPFDLVDYGSRGRLISAEDVFAMFSPLKELAEFEFVEMAAVHSEAMSVCEWSTLAATIEELSAYGQIDGIVVLHGTSTLEEAAWFLHLTTTVSLPIVITGAMRPANGLSSDAAINLAAAVRAACYSPLADLGVVAVLDGEIHSAREVAKVSTYRLRSFESGEVGPIGFIDAAGHVDLYRALRPRSKGFTLDAAKSAPRVDVIFSHDGADGVVVDALTAAGSAGLIVASIAPGVCSPGQLAALEAAAQSGVTVAFSLRCGRGKVLLSEVLTSRGFLAADNLSPQKSRILLALALGAGCTPGEIQLIFDQH